MSFILLLARRECMVRNNTSNTEHWRRGWLRFRQVIAHLLPYNSLWLSLGCSWSCMMSSSGAFFSVAVSLFCEFRYFIILHVLSAGSVLTLSDVLLELPKLTDPVAASVLFHLRVVGTSYGESAEHSPQQQVFTPGCGARHRKQRLLVLQRIFAHGTRHLSVLACVLSSLSPRLHLWVLTEPLSDTIATEQMRAAGQQRSATHHMHLTYLTYELISIIYELVFLDFHIIGALSVGWIPNIYSSRSVPFRGRYPIVVISPTGGANRV
mmetsp:Transcript_29146/g.64435  ORF Transcript_29146/g.64435 Transcript_29146/m.64435 type:complete len:266 (+) Transcript_29146:619-1416(+)